MFKSLKSMISGEEPALSLTINSQDPRNLRSLSAGASHFSFIVNIHCREKLTALATEDEPTEWDYNLRYNNIWSIRTDNRSLDDPLWIPFEEQLHEEFAFCVEIRRRSDAANMAILCADIESEEVCPDQFYYSSQISFDLTSSGWLTAAIDSDQVAWILPFDRALATIPNLKAGKIKNWDDVERIAVGNNHIAVVRGVNQQHEIWTFGKNDHGQRGFQGEEPEGKHAWRRMQIVSPEYRVQQLVCGHWNTFFVLVPRQMYDDGD